MGLPENVAHLLVHPTLRHPSTGAPLTAVGVRKNGQAIWPVLGAEDNPPPPPEPDPKPKPKPADPPADPPRTFSQDEVQRMMAQEKNQGAQRERKRLLESLGLGEDADVASIKATLDKQQADEDARLSETEKAKRDAEADRAAAKREADEAAADRRAARRERLLTGAGVNPELLEDADALLQRSIAPDADEAAIKEAVDKLKERHGGMFGTTATPPRTPSGSPTGTPPRPKPTGDAFERGKERAVKLAAAASGE